MEREELRGCSCSDSKFYEEGKEWAEPEKIKENMVYIFLKCGIFKECIIEQYRCPECQEEWTIIEEI